MEYGVSPTFRLVAAPSSVLQDTDYQFYFSMSYTDWAEEIAAMSAKLSDAVLGQRLVDHEKLGDRLYVSTFADGSRIYVNYADTDAKLGRIKVGAMDFVREEAKQ